MKKDLTGIIIAIILVSGCQSSQSDNSANSQEQANQNERKGYVLKVNEGELAGENGLLIKASPNSGTQGSVIIQDPLPKNFSTGLHYHKKADEFFYILSGTGEAVIDSEEYLIEKGDLIFIPAGHDHKVVVTSDKLETLIFLDKPGLDDEFRAFHVRYLEKGVPPSLKELNEIANKYGTVYKTVQ